MNIKKIIALGLSSMMLFSSIVANAELTDEEGIITAYPTATEIQARNPKVSFVVGEQYETTATAKAAVAVTKKAKVTDDCIYFPVTVTVSDLGRLATGIKMIDDENFILGGCRIFSLKLVLPTTSAKVVLTTSTSKKIGTKAWLDNVVDNTGFNIQWQAGDFTSAYPSIDEEGAIVEGDTSFTVQYLIGIDKNITKDVVINSTDITSEIVYWVGDEQITTAYGSNVTKNINATIQNGVTFKAPVAAEKKWTFTKSEITTDLIDSNKLWKLDVAKSGTPGDITSFGVTFTGKDGSADVSTTRSIKASTINAAVADWNTATSFYVGLNNKSGYTDIDATFSGDAVTGTTVEFK